MNRIRIYFRNHLDVAILTSIALATLILGLMLSLFIFVFTFFHEKLNEKEFCLHNSCIEAWAKYNSSAFDVLGITGGLITGLVTIGGILVAIASYQNSVKTSDLTNHLSHMTIFINYVNSEVDKRSRLAKQEIDTLKWYNQIYMHAEVGKFDISDNYRDFMQSVESQILESNRLYLSSGPDTYLYKNHQTKVLEKMKAIGITMHRLPRLDFHEAEEQVLDLISTINRSFCRNAELISFTNRAYK